MCFSCFCHSKYHKSIMPLPQCDFFNDVYFFLWTAILSSKFYQLASEENKVHTDNLTHCRQILQLINPLTPMSAKAEFLLTISIQYQ